MMMKYSSFFYGQICLAYSNNSNYLKSISNDTNIIVNGPFIFIAESQKQLLTELVPMSETFGAVETSYVSHGFWGRKDVSKPYTIESNQEMYYRFSIGVENYAFFDKLLEKIKNDVHTNTTRLN